MAPALSRKGGAFDVPGPSPLTPEQRSHRARMGGLATAARHDPSGYTQPAHSAFLGRFLDEVDPQRVLPEAERERRAQAARKLHMQRLAWKSAEVRRRKAGR